MLELFLQKYPPVEDLPSVLERHYSPDSLVDALGERSFYNGLYRIHSARTREMIASSLAGAFPEFGYGHPKLFGFDWLGRQFASDMSNGQDKVLMFEPGTAQVLEIPASFAEFHDNELVNFGDAALAQSFFEEWFASSGIVLSASECVAYRIPLFLSGRDELANLEVSDMDVYWSLVTQVKSQVVGLSSGTKLGPFSIG